MKKFQFPSNGKAYLNSQGFLGNRKRTWFQFPSNGKAYLNDCVNPSPRAKERTFQFPSNGKAYLNQK